METKIKIHLITFVLTFMICFPVYQYLFSIYFVDRLFICISIVFILLNFHIIRSNLSSWGYIYSFLLFTAAIVKAINGTNPYVVYEAWHWAFLIILSSLSKHLKNKYFLYIIISVYIVNSLLSFYEFKTGMRLLEFSMNEISVDFVQDSDSQFRSLGLFSHPLISANFNTIVYSFILVSEKIPLKQRILLLGIGLLGIIGFNSRAAMLTVFLLTFVFLGLKKVSLFKVVLLVLIIGIIYEMLPLMLQSGLLGRLEDLNDSSTETRFLAWPVFLSQKWDFYKVLFGGDVIFYPGTKVSLENGYLLTLGYWGIVFGGIKIILDLILPISILKKDVKPIVLLTLCIGCWGCALGNNNSFSFYPLTFLVLATIAFQELKNNKI